MPLPVLGGLLGEVGQQYTSGPAIPKGKPLPKLGAAGSPGTLATSHGLESRPNHGGRTGTQPVLSVILPTACEVVLLFNNHKENLKRVTPSRGTEGLSDRPKHTAKDRAGVTTPSGQLHPGPNLVPPDIPGLPRLADGVGEPTGASQHVPDMQQLGRG